MDLDIIRYCRFKEQLNLHVAGGLPVLDPRCTGPLFGAYEHQWRGVYGLYAEQKICFQYGYQ